MPLTREQYQALAGELEGTAADPEAVARRAFGHDWTAADAAALESRTGVSRCAVCGEWHGRPGRDPEGPDLCLVCALERDAAEDVAAEAEGDD
jgi:hypothetical protein